MAFTQLVGVSAFNPLGTSKTTTGMEGEGEEKLGLA